MIGINVWAKTVKNKVAPPFRKVHFQIHFGKGIVEHEELFDLLRKHCKDNDVIEDGILYKIEGSGAWKTISTTDTSTGEVTSEKKFYKANFDEIVKSSDWASAIDILTAAAMFKKLGTIDGVDIDTESYEEVQALAEELDMDFDVDA